MTFVITQTCVDTMDQSCVEVCPVDCIHFEEGKDRMLYISPVECIDCGACQPACPVSAIFPEADVPADQAHFTEINSLWYEDPDAARAKVGGGAAPAAPAAAPAAATAAETPAEPLAPAAAVDDRSVPATAARPAAPLAASPTPTPSKGSLIRLVRLTFKYGEAGVEGKCALCGVYVIKGGVRFRTKSVLCPDCAKKQESIGDPYRASAGRR